jgi:hypothetical protein
MLCRLTGNNMLIDITQGAEVQKKVESIEVFLLSLLNQQK